MWIPQKRFPWAQPPYGPAGGDAARFPIFPKLIFWGGPRRRPDRCRVILGGGL